jgi:hypothetical protein
VLDEVSVEEEDEEDERDREGGERRCGWEGVDLRMNRGSNIIGIVVVVVDDVWKVSGESI